MKRSFNDLLQQIKKSKKLPPKNSKWHTFQQTLKRTLHHFNQYIENKPIPFLQSLTPQSKLQEELKNIQKKLKKHKPPILHFQTQKLSSDFHALLSQIYRYCQVLKPFIQIRSSSGKKVIQKIFIENFLDSKQKKLLAEFKEENLTQDFLAQQDESKINALIQYKLQKWNHSFAPKQILTINAHYTSLEQMEKLLQYDFKTLLERIQSPPPNWIQPLKELAHILYSMNFYADYYYPIEILGNYLGKSILPKNNIEEFIELLRGIHEKNTLVLLIEYLESNPFFRPIQEPEFSNFVKEFSENLKKESLFLKDKILSQLQEKKIQTLIQNLFGKNPIQTLKSYHASKNPKLIQARCEPYLYSASLNSLLYFLNHIYSQSLEKQMRQILEFSSHKEQKETIRLTWQKIQILHKSTIYFDTNLDSLTEENSQTKFQKSLQSLLQKSRNLEEQELLKARVKAINQKAKSLIEKALKEFSTLLSLLRPMLQNKQNNVLPLETLSFQELQKNYQESQQFLLLLETLFKKDQNSMNHAR